MTSSKDQRYDIQGLRGLAVLSVIIYHVNDSKFFLGYLGVDAFFVISGFLITPLVQDIARALPNQKKTIYKLKLFYKKRFFRLVPGLSVTITASLIVYFIMGNIYEHENISKQILATLFMLGNVGAYFFVGDYFNSNPNPFVHTWSLAIEQQIYLILPIILIFIGLINRKIRFTKIILVIFLFSLSLFLTLENAENLLGFFGLDNPRGINFYSPITRVWEFTIGSLIYLYPKVDKGNPLWINRYTNYLILSTGIIILYLIRFENQNFLAIYICLLTAAIIYNKSLNTLPKLLTGPLIWLGDRSYSLYLVHLPIIFLLDNSFYFGGINKQNFYSYLALGLTLLFGWLLHKYIELPMRFKNNEPGKIKVKRKSTYLTYLINFGLAGTMLVGTSNGYWGLEKPINKPISAFNIDYDCDILNDPDDSPCELSKTTSNKTILLIGDSHASQFADAVRQISLKRDWKLIVWTMGDCKIQNTRRVKNSVTENCVSHNHKVLKWISRNKPNLVLASQYIRKEHSLIELKEGLKEIQKLHQNLAVISNTPVFPDHDFMQRGPILKSFNFKTNFKVSEMETENLSISSKLMGWASHNSIEVISVNRIFCDELTCTRWRNGDWLYSDRTHLSVVGANLAIEILEESLNRLL